MPHKTSVALAVLVFVTMLVVAALKMMYDMMQDTATGVRSKRLSSANSVPAFTLTNANAQAFGLQNLTGKVWVADFVFTTCATTCPIMMEQTSKLQKALPSKSGLTFVSISINPTYDTPAVLKDFAQKHRANHKNWQFLTGPIEDIKRLSVEGLKIGSPEEPLNHSTHFVLVDRRANIRGYYDATDDDAMAKLKKDARYLLENPDA
ncbi:MAG: protein SCO1/2 [Candidatus Promineifilaceae bacterium]|jgi:protein SCO1